MSARARVARPAEPLVRATLTASAFEQLLSYVVKGHWKAGERIPPERELCQQLRIARTSLREALKAMELIGMLDSRIGDGTFVCPRSEFLSRPLLWAFTGTDHAELRDIIEAREFLERDLAGLAAERGSEAEIDAIGAAVNAMRENITESKSILEPDLAFHLAIATAAHNEVLRNAVQLLLNLLKQWLVLKLLLPTVPSKVLKQHEDIYRAIRSRDVAGARDAMWGHLEDTAQLLQQIVQKRGKSNQDGRVRRPGR
ncbi:MAG TPA: FadR/GntR family transcriptional regulator [Bryobacteraceae bacterium]|jgi:GntR family transcriptional repressor for pyruvate dehydrogenase complex|nr:FadR/GntR family transcriptional regulator [Bryobacteraceae bacterium]